jgi:ATP-dependent DNA ligase
MPYDTLYKTDSNNNLREWTISVTSNGDGTYSHSTRYGQVGGTIITGAPTIVSAGNQGRTVLEQAELDARSEWLKKIDQGYVVSMAGARNQTVVLPMLAKKFADGGRRWTQFPAAIQRKFDGVRCMASMPTAGQVVLMSRGNKLFPGMGGIRADILNLNLPSNIILDGELYADPDDVEFERASGIVRKKPENYTESDIQVTEFMKLRVYDLIDLNNLDMTFANRYRLMVRILNQVPAARRTRVRFVENYPINSYEDVETYTDQFVEEGYEGGMVRNLNSVYKLNGKSSDLMKVKRYEETEFPIVGYTEGQGTAAGTPIWICENEAGARFNVAMNGTREYNYRLWAERDAIVARRAPLTVEHKGWTNGRKPREARGKVLREYE